MGAEFLLRPPLRLHCSLMHDCLESSKYTGLPRLAPKAQAGFPTAVHWQASPPKVQRVSVSSQYWRA